MTVPMNTHTPPPPHALPAAPPRDPRNAFRDLTEAMIEFERSAAGYFTLDRAVRTMINKLHPGESSQGIPLIEHPGSADGVHVIDKVVCNFNAKNEEGEPLLKGEAVEYLLGTMCAMHQRQGGVFLRRMRALLDELETHFP